MSEEKRPGDQNPITVIPNAAIVLLQAMLETMAQTSPEQLNAIKEKIDSQRDSSLAASNPKSFELLDILFRGIPKGPDE